MRTNYRRLLRLMGRIMVILLVLIPLAVAAEFAYYIVWPGAGATSPDLAKISRMISAKLPRNARLIGSRLDPIGIDGILWAKIEIGRGDVGASVNSLPSPRKVSRSERLDIGKERPQGCSWWDPEKPHSFLALRMTHPNADDSLMVLIGRGQGKVATVYVCEWLM